MGEGIKYLRLVRAAFPVHAATKLTCYPRTATPSSRIVRKTWISSTNPTQTYSYIS